MNNLCRFKTPPKDVSKEFYEALKSCRDIPWLMTQLHTNFQNINWEYTIEGQKLYEQLWITIHEQPRAKVYELVKLMVSRGNILNRTKIEAEDMSILKTYLLQCQVSDDVKVDSYPGSRTKSADKKC